MKHLTKLILLLLILPACATSSGSGSGDSGLMGLGDEPAKAVWEDWTAKPAAGIAPEAFVDQMVAFDYWQVDDENFIEESWAGVSGVLDFVRREGLPEAQENTATLLLQALDSRQGDQQTSMDVTYVVSLDQQNPSEGLVVRLYSPIADKKATPGVAIYMGRDSGSPAEGYDRAVIWAAPDFEEAEGFTVALDRTDAGWVAAKDNGVVYPVGESKSDSLTGAAGLAREILTKRFWEPLTGVGFVEAKQSATEESELPADIERALGLEVRERQIEEVYKDTVFPPRAEIPPLGLKEDF
ncbi:hypothetical protein FIV42_18765 [Persicimonas caeni]|uniref:DUF3313 domain-containing protein n=1 Tax=Persicimonas caeni TaxID=2292766 RepID=A0A4Y6PWL6_PERCE|nr:hypothetical protein [Persicimonas caeni]QDG52706.1 hypothetical protein FIV42_18765 [Persicimonas caeni]QED33928.1 hypothetical protein FRD00_18760 [Persicimonas caeni]